MATAEWVDWYCHRRLHAGCLRRPLRHLPAGGAGHRVHRPRRTCLGCRRPSAVRSAGR
ncbi:hypothetical protein ABZV69_26950 [Streptomyces microflavus]